MKHFVTAIVLILCPIAVAAQGNGYRISEHATASASAGITHPPSNAVDGNPATMWSSEAFAPQWIELDLGKPTRLSKLRLLTAMFPQGPTTNAIYAGGGPNPQTKVHEFTVSTTATWVEKDFAPPLEGVRFVRVVTKTSPSFVAWSEIEAYEPWIGKIVVASSPSAAPPRLVDSASGQTFVVRANQYHRLVPLVNPTMQTIWHPDWYDANAVALAFKQMKGLGYNAARVMFNGEWDTAIAGSQHPDEPTGFCTDNNPGYQITDCVNDQSLNNLVQGLTAARNRNIKVILSMGILPWRYSTPGGIGGWNGFNHMFLRQQSIQDYGRFVRDVVEWLEPRIPVDTILVVQPWAEPQLHMGYAPNLEFPFDDPNRVLTSANFYVPPPPATQHVVGNITPKTNGLPSQGMREILAYSMIGAFNHWFGQVRAADPTMLLMYEQFAAYAISTEPGRWVDDLVVVTPFMQADILGWQIYPEFREYVGHPEHTMGNIFGFTPGFTAGLSSIAKPFLMLEHGLIEGGTCGTGTHAWRAGDYLTNWQANACRWGIDGWSLFNWDMNNFCYITATENNFALGRALSPNARPVACSSSLDRTTTTSNGAGGLATDGNIATAWNAGGVAPQWIEVDLGQQISLSQVRLYVNQFPGGATHHRVYAGPTPNPTVQIANLQGTYTSGTAIVAEVLPPLPGVRYVRVETVTSPSWVSWLEIEVY